MEQGQDPEGINHPRSRVNWNTAKVRGEKSGSPRLTGFIANHRQAPEKNPFIDHELQDSNGWVEQLVQLKLNSFFPSKIPGDDSQVKHISCCPAKMACMSHVGTTRIFQFLLPAEGTSVRTEAPHRSRVLHKASTVSQTRGTQCFARRIR